MTADGHIFVTVTTIISDEGSVVVMEGTDEDGNTFRFGVDHRMAQPIVDDLNDGLEPWAQVPVWAILGGAR